MVRPDWYNMFPMVLHEVTLRNYYCCEFAYPGNTSSLLDVGFHVIYCFKGNRIDYTVWCYKKSVPLMRFVGTASFAFTDPSREDVDQVVLYHFFHDRALITRSRKFLHWIKDVKMFLRPLDTIPHGPELEKKYHCFEFYLPGCVYDRPDIKLQVTFQKAGEKIEYNVWCQLDHYPLLGYVGHGEFHIDRDDEGYDIGSVSRKIVSKFNPDDHIFQEISDFLSLPDTIQL